MSPLAFYFSRNESAWISAAVGARCDTVDRAELLRRLADPRKVDELPVVELEAPHLRLLLLCLTREYEAALEGVPEMQHLARRLSDGLEFLTEEPKQALGERFPLLPTGAEVAGRYRIRGLLFTGALGTTYTAEELEGGGAVALKEYPFPRAIGRALLSQLAREARDLPRLDHPAIAPHHPAFHVEEADAYRFYQPNEMIEGQSLRQLVAEGWRPDEGEAKAIADAVLGALAHAHDLDPPVLHRNLRPGFVIRDRRGAWRLVGFGQLLKLYRTALSLDQQANELMGYLAPEQYRGEEGPAADLYSLAITLLHAQVGKPPITLPVVDRKIHFRPHLQASAGFASWLDRLLDPDPGYRFPSAAAARVALRRLDDKPWWKKVTGPLSWPPWTEPGSS